MVFVRLMVFVSRFKGCLTERANPVEPATYSKVHFDEAKFWSLTLEVNLLHETEAILSPTTLPQLEKFKAPLSPASVALSLKKETESSLCFALMSLHY